MTMTEQEIRSVYCAIYEMTNSITVTKFDCGTLCEKKCCKTFAHPQASHIDLDYGMELYPGEEFMLAEDLADGKWITGRFLSGKEYHLPSAWRKEDGVFFVGCTKPCPRDRRPLQCRLFPYKPVLKPSGIVSLELEKGAPNYCPILEEQLDPDARKVLLKAVQLLATIPKVRELLWWDAQP
jgi:hypothetical protein